MKRILLGIIIALGRVVVLQYCQNTKEDRAEILAGSALIQKELKNVGKLIVTEGQYSQILNYSTSRDLFYGCANVRKSGLVVVNAKATSGYDLSKNKTEIDEAFKTVYITQIPQAELNI